MRIRLVLGCVVTLVTLPVLALDDPTRPANFQAAPVATTEARAFSLDSIVIGPGKRVAVIDGIARQEGESFNGARLLRVYPDRVELKDQGRTQTLNWTMPPKVRISR